uniref:Uncharacterized protein n=1 Tax=Caenorhabditis japonica TaxID=281687 RepID=A0A8R1ES56_CAEJA
MTVSECAEKLRKLGSYAYVDIELKSRERLLASQFWNGVNKDFRSELRRLPTMPKTLREMTLSSEKNQPTSEN